MIVKIGNKFTDSKDEPIMIILVPGDIDKMEHIEKRTKFLACPVNSNLSDMREFMKDEAQIKE